MNIFLVLAFIPLILSIGITPAFQYDLIPEANAAKAKGNSLPETNSNKVCGDRLCSEVDNSNQNTSSTNKLENTLTSETKNTDIEFNLDYDEIELLFIQSSNSGTMIKSNEGYTLTLNGVSPATAWFTDRPDRLAGTETTQDFIDHWSFGEDNFDVNPPNAAIKISEADQSRDLIIVELTNPVYDGEKNTLQYDVVILSSASGALAYHGQFADEMIPETFEEAILFIDSRGGCFACKAGIWISIIGLGVATFGAGVGIEDEIVSKIVQKLAAKGVSVAAEDIIANASTKHGLAKFLCYKMHACSTP